MYIAKKREDQKLTPLSQVSSSLQVSQSIPLLALVVFFGGGGGGAYSQSQYMKVLCFSKVPEACGDEFLICSAPEQEVINAAEFGEKLCEHSAELRSMKARPNLQATPLDFVTKAVATIAFCQWVL